MNTKPWVEPDLKPATMFEKRKPTDTTAHVHPAKKRSVVADSVADDANARGAMDDKPLDESSELAVIDLTMDEEMFDLTTVGTDRSSNSGQSPAGSTRQPSLDTRIEGTRPSFMPGDSQSQSTSESRALGSAAHISSAAQPDTSSTNTWRTAMATAATSLYQPVNMVGNITHSSTSPPRPSAGRLLPLRQPVGPYGTGFTSASQPFDFQDQLSECANTLARGLYGLPEAQAHREAERQQILQAFQKQPSTPSIRRTEQQRGYVTTPNMSLPAMCRSRDEQYTAFSSSLSSEALIQCCPNPYPFDISEEDGIIGPNIVCLSCHTPHDAADIFTPAAQSTGNRATVIEDGQYFGSGNVKNDPDPNRIRVVQYIKDELHDISKTYKPSPPAYHQPLGEALFSQCYDVEESICPGRSFYKFMELPRELRERIYGFALKSDKPIAPHLCDEGRPAPEGKADYGKAIRFHDENQTAHNATCKLLAMTRVSKQVREESLPIFYGVNTFEANGDTPTYFFHLQHLGRFHMIRHVDFWARFWKNDQYPQKHMRMLLQNIEEQKVFEAKHGQATQNGRSNKAKAATAAKNAAAKGRVSKVSNVSEDTKLFTDDLDLLKSHPLHLMGGLEAHFSSSFLVLRMLSAQFQDNEYSRQLVIHVPIPTLFEQYNSLQYFPLVCEGLGIQLKLISGRDVDMYGSSFRLSWAQKYQKKDFTALTTAKDWNEGEALTKRVQALYPNIEELQRPAKWTYMRHLCKQNEIEWFSIKTAGGGIR
ncbi:hypothetical protein PMIN06_011050 [Paraphaeosphaeria minitans]|uniref:2EXR domain-containing protein n=1 Tax=Paraphaeosphaeria minitans TaxID=565426 RepID=A0A9P6GST3_9PLEO|nr:hypothetical protein PMIN01_00255 [Paraphaeosphaeria minitans]